MPGIYIHIPFCKRKCRYCDFLSFDNEFNKSTKYISALVDSIKPLSFDKIDSIFIGGGTPSLLDPGSIGCILGEIRKKFLVSPKAEITIEANPGTVCYDTLASYKDQGINRISFGVQSFDDNILRQLGRIHNSEEAVNAIRYAQKAGFDNINIDLMFGIPGYILQSSNEHYPPQSLSSFENSLSTAVALGATHISAYSLIVEEGTLFYHLMSENPFSNDMEDLDRQMYESAINLLTEKGFVHYELSNFAYSGKECQHNIKYWTGEEYIGFGLNAASFVRSGDSGEYLRLQVHSDINRFIAGDHSYYKERISVKERQNEFMMLGFRLIKGPDPVLFEKLFHCRYSEVYKDKLKILYQKGLICCDDKERYFLSQKGLDIANQVFMEFI